MTRYAGPVPCGACGRHLRLPEPSPDVGAADLDLGPHRCPLCGVENRIWRFLPFRHPAKEAVAAPAAGTPCAYHTGNEAVETCVRCGSFLCGICVTPLSDKTYCTACFGILQREGGAQAGVIRYPRPHTMAAGFALGSFLPFVGVVCLGLTAWMWVRTVRLRREIAANGERAWLSIVAIPFVWCFAVLGQVSMFWKLRS